MTNDCSDAIDLGTDIQSMQEIPDPSNMCNPNRRCFPSDVYSPQPSYLFDTNLHEDSTIVTAPRRPKYSLYVLVAHSPPPPPTSIVLFCRLVHILVTYSRAPWPLHRLSARIIDFMYP